MFPLKALLCVLVFTRCCQWTYSTALRESKTTNRVTPLMAPPRIDETADDKHFTKKVKIVGDKTIVAGRGMMKVEHESFQMPRPYREPYMQGADTESGGIYTESLSVETCHQKKKKLGYCPVRQGCYDLIPGNDYPNACFVYAADGECLCIDPCRLFGVAENEKLTGDVLEGSGCERCVRHKNNRFFSWTSKLQPTRSHPRVRPNWVYKSSGAVLGVTTSATLKISCGMCEDKCVSGGKHGPKFNNEICNGEWSFVLSDCRKMDLTDEEMKPYSEGQQSSEGAGSGEFSVYIPSEQEQAAREKGKE
jgi:hypothetical protein